MVAGAALFLVAQPGKAILKEAWLLTNPTEAPITEAVDVAGWAQVEDLVDEPIAREGQRVTLTVPALDVRVLVLSR